MEPWEERYEKARKMVIFISKIMLDITLANEVSSTTLCVGVGRVSAGYVCSININWINK